MLLDRLDASTDEFAAATGWEVKPEGACRGEVCVPLPLEARRDDGRLDVQVVGARLRMPIVHDEVHGLWALGPATVGGRTLDAAKMPELVLPDVDGNPFDLAALHGRKVLLTAWASW